MSLESKSNYVPTLLHKSTRLKSKSYDVMNFIGGGEFQQY